LVKAWDAAGINAELKEKSSSSTLNSMYGCINQYMVLLDDEQFMLLEYDLKNLNSTAERYIKFIDENGYEQEYRNGEFQYGMKKSAAAELHVSYSKNLFAVMKQLNDMLEIRGTGGGDSFETF